MSSTVLRSGRDHSRLRALFFTLLILLAGGLPGCALVDGGFRGDRSVKEPASPDQGLLTAYVLLANTLSEESKLGALGFLKTITFHRPVPEVDEIMDRLSDISSDRLDELETLRSLSPDVSMGPKYMDPIGEAITSNATDAGMDEMLDFGGSFGIRFVFLQAQATRMVGAIAMAAAEIEPNQRRKKWLTDLAKEYESLRNELVVIVEQYIMQEGDAQEK